MTQQELIEFTGARCFSLLLGTRNKELQPTMARAFGVRLSDDGKALSAYIKKEHSNDILADLKDNGRVALVISNISNYDTKQFKGAYLSHGELTDADMTALQGNLKGFTDICGQYYGEEMVKTINGFNLFPLVSITFTIEDIFNQTPGPGAGQKIN